MNKKQKYSKTLFFINWFVRVLMILLLIYSFVGIFRMNDDSNQSRYIFISLNAVSLLVLTFLPSILEKKWKIDIPNFMEIIFILFCSAALLFGEIAEFYVYVSHWDSLLHTISGSLIAIVGFSIIKLLNDNPKEQMHLSPFFVALFVVCFAITMGVIWEIFEFVVDLSSGSNMQRYKNSITLEDFPGQLALMDTMKDLILDFIGALIVAVLGYIDLKRSSKWLSRFAITKEANNESN